MPVLRESELYISGHRAQQQLFEDESLNDDADEIEEYPSYTQAVAKSHDEYQGA